MLLGPLRVLDDDGSVVTPAGARQRSLLACLLMRANTPVSAEVLVDTVWDGSAPHGSPETMLRSTVMRLRRALGRELAGRISAHAPGDPIRVDGGELDVLRFEALCHEAGAALRDRAWATASDSAARAVDLWQGEPLIDVPSQVLRGQVVPRLEQLRLQALDDGAEADLQQGRYEELVPRLRELTAAYPLRERFHAQLMEALSRAGRRAEALEVYRDARTVLVEQLGIEPGSDLRQLHQQILSGGDAAPRSTPARSMPRQLPAATRHFTGRVMELVDLDRVHDTSAVVITAIDGMAGVGKTALAVQAAHAMVERYPDGQLFIDLHGYTAGVAPVEPGDALDRMLRSLGVAAENIPVDLDERAGLYRSRLAGRQVLVLLDNAATEDQVTPLLPGLPGCLVLITSRRRLAGLDHTHTLSLDTLPPADAVALFRNTADGNLFGQPDAVAELVELCGRLPLAIRIAAARLRSHPAWNPDHLAERLRDQQHRLVELAAGQRSVTVALDLSYQDLSTELRRTYRLLGLYPGTDIELYAVAALLDSSLPHAGHLLEQLLDAHLLQEPAPGRYRFHDLVRAHAAHTATGDGTERDARTALDRLLDYYRHNAAVAMDAAYPFERERRPQVAPAHTPGPVLSDSAKAVQWLDDELPNLLAAARYAAEHDRPAHLLDLSTILHRHLRIRGPYREAVVLHRQALTTARATGHQAAELQALVDLGHIHRLQGRHEQAADYYQRALTAARATGHRAAEMEALVGLGHIHRLRGEYEQATDHLQLALQTRPRRRPTER